MHSAQDTGRPFTPAGPFDLDEVLRDSLGIHTGEKVASVEVRFEQSVARYVREHAWHETVEFDTAEDGRLRLRMNVAINPELEMKIHRWGPCAEVIGPASLRERFVEYARRHQAMYLSC
jgi:predicted DNA-binding transcriptional regulator YafY